MENSLPRTMLNYNENVANEAQILTENGDKQSQNTHVEVNIFARKKSKVRSRVWIVQNIIAHAIEHGRGYIKILFMVAQWNLDRTSAHAMFI